MKKLTLPSLPRSSDHGMGFIHSAVSPGSKPSECSPERPQAATYGCRVVVLDLHRSVGRIISEKQPE
jgi:hypothetical protein